MACFFIHSGAILVFSMERDCWTSLHVWMAVLVFFTSWVSHLSSQFLPLNSETSACVYKNKHILMCHDAPIQKVGQEMMDIKCCTSPSYMSMCVDRWCPCCLKMSCWWFSVCVWLSMIYSGANCGCGLCVILKTFVLPHLKARDIQKLWSLFLVTEAEPWIRLQRHIMSVCISEVEEEWQVAVRSVIAWVQT